MTALLPLDIWRHEMGLSPWHFWGLADTRIVPIVANCSDLTFEYSWQGSDAAGREDVRWAIERAEEKLRTYLGYRPAPQYAEETIAWPRVGDAQFMRLRNLDATGRRVGVFAPEGYIQQLGIEQLTSIGTAAVGGGTLVYSDLFSTGFHDTFTITLPTTVTDPAQIAVYFAAADRWDGSDASERWRVQPVMVRISGGNVIITGRRWLVVKPLLYQNPRPNTQGLDPNNAANFVTSLEVYQRTTNTNGNTLTTSQATLVYESSDCGGWGAGFCCGCSGLMTNDPAAQGLVIARSGIRDSRLGLVTPAAAVYDATSGTWGDAACASCYAEPDRVTLRYLAGYPLESGQMARRWQAVVAKLAAAELKRRICACRESNERLHDLQQDLTLESTETERYAVAPEDLSNPFGTRRGHVQAWRESKDHILRRGIAA